VVCPLERAHTLVTDTGAPDQALQMLRDAGVETMVVDPLRATVAA